MLPWPTPDTGITSAAVFVSEWLTHVASAYLWLVNDAYTDVEFEEVLLSGRQGGKRKLAAKGRVWVGTQLGAEWKGYIGDKIVAHAKVRLCDTVQSDFLPCNEGLASDVNASFWAWQYGKLYGRHEGVLVQKWRDLPQQREPQAQSLCFHLTIPKQTSPILNMIVPRWHAGPYL